MDNEVRRTTQISTATPANIAFFLLLPLQTATPIRKVKPFVGNNEYAEKTENMVITTRKIGNYEGYTVLVFKNAKDFMKRHIKST